MLTLCPSCHARVKLLDEHEGTRVRCTECGRVYLARPCGGGRRHLRFWLAVALGLVALIVLLLRLRTQPDALGAEHARAPSASAPPPAETVAPSPSAPPEKKD